MNVKPAEAKRSLALARASISPDTKKLNLLDSIATSLLVIAEAISDDVEDLRGLGKVEEL